MVPAALHIMVVEDDPGDVALLRRSLRDLDGTLRHVGTAEDAIAALKPTSGRPDVVLLDLGLPDSSGLSALLTVRRIAPEVPVVVLTGNVDDELAQQAIAAGAQDYLVKGSLSEDAVRRAVRGAVERQSMRTQLDRHLHHSRALLGLSQRALADPDPARVLQAAVDVLLATTAADQAAGYADSGDGLRLVALGAGLLPAAPAMAGEETLAWHIGANGTSELIRDLSEEVDLPLPDGLLHGRPRSVLTVPIGVVEGRRSFLAAYALAPDAFDGIDVAHAEGLAAIVTQAHQRWAAEHAQANRVRELRALAGVARALEDADSVDSACRATVDELVRAMQFPQRSWAVARIDEVTCQRGVEVRTDVASLTAPIRSRGEERGSVAVGYDADLGFMLPFEQDMVAGVAELVSSWLERREAHVALAISEERLRLLLGQLPAVVWATDADGIVTDTTGVRTPDTTLEAEHVVGRSALDFLDDEEGRNALRNSIARARQGETSDITLAALGRVFRNRAHPLRDAAGDISGVLHLAFDVTDEERRRAELVEIRLRLSGVWEHSLNAMVLTDDDGRIIEANPAAERLSGYSRAELLGAAVESFASVGVEDLDRLRAEFEGGDRTLTGIVPMRRKDGEEVFAEYHAAGDVVPGVHLLVVNDVTQRIRAERERQRSEERFRAMAENAEDGIYRLRLVPEWQYEYLNPAVETLTGCSLQEIYDDARVPFDRIHPEDQEVLLRHFESVTGVQLVAFRFQRPDGEWRHLEDRQTPIVEDGRVIGVQGIVRDVSTRRRAEDALRVALESEQRAVEELSTLSDLKSSFLQAISHELRTPMSSILGYSHTLSTRGDMLDATQIAYFHERLLHNAQRLAKLLEDILDLERLSRAPSLAHQRPVRILGVVEAVVDALEQTTHPIELDVPDLVVPVDQTRLERILDNLLRNAVKHTPEGTAVRVRVWMERNGLELAVEDDGPGIPESLRDVVFEPFHQGPDMAAAASPGTGIGLTLVKQLAVSHGGDAWVESEPGEGARFRIRLATVQPTAVEDVELALPDGDAVLRGTLDQLGRATNREHASGTLLAYVYRLGGETRGGPEAAADAVPVDLSLGQGEPVRAIASSEELRAQLEVTLPFLLAYAARLLAPRTLGDTTGQVAVAPPELLHQLLGTSRAGDVLLRLACENPAVETARWAAEHTRPSDLIIDTGRGSSVVLVLREVGDGEVEPLVARIQDQWAADHEESLIIVPHQVGAETVSGLPLEELVAGSL